MLIDRASSVRVFSENTQSFYSLGKLALPVSTLRSGSSFRNTADLIGAWVSATTDPTTNFTRQRHRY
jgi:hypothetical protein